MPVTAQALVAVLAGLGVDAGTPEAVRAAHEEADLRDWRRVLPPTVVMREGWTPWVAVHVPHGTGVDVHVELEDGGRRHVRAVDNWVDPREVDGVLDRSRHGRAARRPAAGLAPPACRRRGR